MYTDVLDDTKINSISSLSFKVFVFLMSILTAEDQKDGIISEENSLSWRLRMSKAKLKKSIDELEKHGMVKRQDGAIIVVNWSKRQFKSDDINARVKRFRSVTKDESETLHETLQVTTQNRTDTEQNRTDTEQSKKTVGDIDVLSEYILKHLKISMSDKSETKKLIKSFSLQYMIDAVDRMEIYFAAVKENKWKVYVIGKHWRNLYEKLEYFSSNENLKAKLEHMTAVNSAKPQEEDWIMK